MVEVNEDKKMNEESYTVYCEVFSEEKKFTSYEEAVNSFTEYMIYISECAKCKTYISLEGKTKTGVISYYYEFC